MISITTAGKIVFMSYFDFWFWSAVFADEKWNWHLQLQILERGINGFLWF